MSASLGRRYFFKLLANILAVPVYLLMEAILPRALGPQNYGNFNFATSLFQQFSGFLDMGTSTCLYNSLSKKPFCFSLFSFYARIIGIVGLLIFLCSLLFLAQNCAELLMPGVPAWIAPYAACWAFLTWLGRVFRSTNDAIGLTVSSELWRSAISILGVLLLAALYELNFLNLHTLFLQQYFVLAFSAGAYFWVSINFWKKDHYKLTLKLSQRTSKNYAKEFFSYSHPLFIQAILSFLMLTVERWLLQWFDGSIQQGFFALSQKVSMACFLFVSAMTPLLMREFSIAWSKNNLAAMASLMKRFAPLLYALAAYFSCFTLIESKTLVYFFGGEEFAQALLPVQIMSLYPLHQAYGQIAGSIFHATGRTYILRNLTACECAYGLLAAWLLLAPNNLCGLNLGATGLALKTVCVQFISVNIYLYLASRLINFSFWKNFSHQILCVLCFLTVAILSREITFYLADAYPPAIELIIMRFILSGFIYSIAILALFFYMPAMLGLSRQELKELFIRLKLALQGKINKFRGE